MIKLVIGDKNLSTWSMRAWLVLKQSGLTFEEVMIPLDGPVRISAVRLNLPL
jgi:glutathione S-transferase